MQDILKMLIPSSKTNQGLLLILGISTGLAIGNKLTPEMVEVLKYVSISFFGVRGAANVMEKKSDADTSGQSK